MTMTTIISPLGKYTVLTGFVHSQTVSLPAQLSGPSHYRKIVQATCMPNFVGWLHWLRPLVGVAACMVKVDQVTFGRLNTFINLRKV